MLPFVLIDELIDELIDDCIDYIAKDNFL